MASFVGGSEAVPRLEHSSWLGEGAGYLLPLENLSSIIAHGLLSHNAAAAVEHRSLAEPTVQGRREGRLVNGRALHSYVNLYLNPRNAMMYRVSRRIDSIAVLWADLDRALELPGVVVTDRNASVEGARWFRGESGLAELDLDALYSDRWVIDGRRNTTVMQAMQAELLVPDRLDPGYFAGISVPSHRVLRAVSSTPVPVRVEPSLFFL